MVQRQAREVLRIKSPCWLSSNAPKPICVTRFGILTLTRSLSPSASLPMWVTGGLRIRLGILIAQTNPVIRTNMQFTGFALKCLSGSCLAQDKTPRPKTSKKRKTVFSIFRYTSSNVRVCTKKSLFHLRRVNVARMLPSMEATPPIGRRCTGQFNNRENLSHTYR